MKVEIKLETDQGTLVLSNSDHDNCIAIQCGKDDDFDPMHVDIDELKIAIRKLTAK